MAVENVIRNGYHLIHGEKGGTRLWESTDVRVFIKTPAALLRFSLFFVAFALRVVSSFYISEAPSAIITHGKWNDSTLRVAPSPISHPLHSSLQVTAKAQNQNPALYAQSSKWLKVSKHSSMKIEITSPSSEVHPPSLQQSLAPTPSNNGFGNPSASPLSNCCKADMIQKRASEICDCIYPIKLEILLLNVSLSLNWSAEFLHELASQLNLQVFQLEIDNFYVIGSSKMNISMNIIPITRISFSSSEAHMIQDSFAFRRIYINPALVGDYRLLNLTWFKPTAPSPAPSRYISPEAPPIQGSSHSKSSNSPDEENRHRNLSVVIIVIIGVGIFIIIIISALIVCACRSHGTKQELVVQEMGKQLTIHTDCIEGPLPYPTSTRFLTYEELKDATNNFEPASILGEGGFGRVFKGKLSDGTPVAIKKLTGGGQQGDKEFLVEVEMLSRLHHRNLVKLVGYCSSRDSSQNLLCYELIPNGSLESWLHGRLGSNQPLDWDTRIKIALDAARGLAYLHEDSQPCVIHRDFKSSNILIENNFQAKVSDFGLAKQAPEGKETYLSTRVMGTFGYVAPEYAMTGHLLVKSDVYSYGVVLLELLTGRKPVDMSQPSGKENLVAWARPILRDKDRLDELVDPRLGDNYPKEDFSQVCTIAAACVSPEASQRPTMGEVVQSLKMVRRFIEQQDLVLTSTQPTLQQSSTTYETDKTSSIFNSEAYSGIGFFENDNVSKAAFSEDLHEGR